MESPSSLESSDTINFDNNLKLVPWLNWDEWDHVRLSLFSPSPDSVSSALRRIATWRSRGCLPVAIEITASFVEIQRRDAYFSGSSDKGAVDSEEMLAMLYTMAIMRLVNGIIEKTRDQNGISIAAAAADFKMPRMLIDIRHEGSHRELPSLHLLRRASIMALDWLKSYYWDRQKNTIPYQSGESGNVRREIKSRLRELASSLKVKHGSNSSEVKGKRAKHQDQLIGATFHGRSKLFSLMACRLQPSKIVGSKKQIVKMLKNLVRLYSFFSSDVVSVLLALLLKVSYSTDFMHSPEKLQINLSLDVARDVFDEWEPVITELSTKEPELLLDLLKAVLHMIESRRATRDHFGGDHFGVSQYDSETQRIRVLSSIFAWLVRVLKGLNFTPPREGHGSQTEGDCCLPRTMLIELMRRCLRLADPEDNELLGSSLLLGELVWGSSLNGKIHKLFQLTSLHSRHAEEVTSDVKAEELIDPDKFIRQAAEKFEMIKHRKLSTKSSSRTQDATEANGNLWTMAKSWNPCPIGMLPRAVGSSGSLPVLDFGTDDEVKAALCSSDNKQHTESRHCSKRESTCDIETIDDSSIKRMKMGQDLDSVQQDELASSKPDDLSSSQPDERMVTIPDGVEGRLLIGGFYQEVGHQDVQNILSRVRLLVT